MTAQPSDYENKDGELAVSVNLLNEEGHLSPLLPAEVVKELPSGTAAVYIHDTSKFKHYIVISTTGSISWIDETDMETTHSTGFTISGIKKVVPLGNTLCILSEGGMDYLLWNAETEAYKKLDPQLPEIKLSFGLQCEFMEDKNRVDAPWERGHWEIVGTHIMAVVNRLVANCTHKSKFCMPFFIRYAYRLFDGSLTCQSAPILMIPSTGEPITLVRCVAFNSSSSTVTIDSITGQVVSINGYKNNVCIASYVPACDIDMAVVDIDENIEDYTDIIKNLEIFISTPMWTYDQSGNMYKNSGTDDSDISEFYDKDPFYDQESSFGVYKLKEILTQVGTYARRPTIDALLMTKLSNCFDATPSPGYNYKEFPNYLHPQGRVKLPPKKSNDDIQTCSSFYRLKTISLNDLISWNTRKIIEIDEGILDTLTTREVLTDDYDSHNEKTAKDIYSYNQRLLLGGITKKLFNGYFEMPCVDKRVSWTIGHSSTKHVLILAEDYNSNMNDYYDDVYDLTAYTPTVHDDLFNATEVYVNIKKNGKEYVVKEDLGTGIKLMGGFENMTNPDTPEGRSGDYSVPWFYYPDPDAYEARIRTYRQDLDRWFHYKVTLKPHDMLNGAYYFDNFAWNPLNTGTVPTPTTNNWVEYPNKLYTSEVLNPWYFPVEGIVTVGNGELLALSAATQALSQGQFGQFPLYAFCSDGVWALTVGDTGYFTRSVPVSRDVCTNPDSVLQIDDSVIYPTDRGLMLLAGSKNICFTEPMNNREGKDYESQLPGMNELRAMAGLTAPSTNATVATRQHRCLNPAPLREFLQDCKMIYDYVGQKIVVYNPKIETYEDGQVSRMYRKYKYALVYSLKTNLWGMTETDLQWTVNSYPEAMGMTDEKKLVVFSKTTQEESSQQSAVTGLFVTRPLKLGAPDVLKTVRTVMQRGMFRRGDVKSVLWGSRDLYNWYLIHSSQDEGLHNMSGTPYKYFIIGGLVTLTEGKSVSGASLEVEAKMTDVLR